MTSSVLRIGGTFTVALPEVPTDSQVCLLLLGRGSRRFAHAAVSPA